MGSYGHKVLAQDLRNGHLVGRTDRPPTRPVTVDSNAHYGGYAEVPPRHGGGNRSWPPRMRQNRPRSRRAERPQKSLRPRGPPPRPPRDTRDPRQASAGAVTLMRHAPQPT